MKEVITTESIRFEEFRWFSPGPKKQLAITIPDLENLRLNSKLVEEIPKYVEIGVGDQGSTICIREKLETGYKVPKCGIIRDKNLIRYLVDAGVHLPARYTVTKEEGCWIATLEATGLPTVNLKRPPRRQKKSDMAEFIKEVKGL